MCMRRLDEVRDLPEDADDVLAAQQRHRTDLDLDPLAAGVDEREAGVGDRRRPDDLAGEVLPRAPRVLRCDDGGELSPLDIADDPLRGRVDPADDPRSSSIT